MNLNRFTFGILLFLSLSSVASSQQATQADIQTLDRRVQALETKVSNLEIMMKEMETRLTIKIEELDKRLTARIDGLAVSINILIGVVLAAIALPQVLGYLQGRREREEFHQQIQDLRVEMRDLGERLERQQQAMFEKLNQQQQEITEIKSRRIVTTS